MVRDNKCKFNIWYKGRCNKPCEGDVCFIHESRCAVCGKQSMFEHGFGQGGPFAITEDFCSEECLKEYMKGEPRL